MSNNLYYGPSGYPGPIHAVEFAKQVNALDNTETACLLEGTLVKTPTGYRLIENLRLDDYVISHRNINLRVVKTHKWSCNVENKSDVAKRIYKIPAGKQNNTTDLYLTFFHRVFSAGDGWLRKPISLGYKEAADHEISKNGKYNIYHIRIENGEENHLIVNGGCFVESWIDIPYI